ncbi:MAG: site-specific integrase [Gammaproteobacteria bacterium]|nr:MAG: site-specific integrase [Gammaproteobacteria bacterium]
MGRKKMPGLVKRGNIWHINKKVNGRRISESTGSSSLEEAERYLVHRLEQIRQANVYGIRPKRTFREAATKYLLENKHKASIKEDARWLMFLDPLIGNMTLESIHMGSLQFYIQLRRESKVKARTINYGLQTIRRILNLASGEWLDEHGLTWLSNAPKIKLLPEDDKRKPFPLNWDEQRRLFSELPIHLRRMALFAVNTGCRDREICRLKWEWEIPVPELEVSVFIIPGHYVKNRQDRLIVLNKVASLVIQEVRNNHSDYVFTFKNKPITRMLNSAWKKARIRSGLPKVRVHDLKHTFGRRLRAAGVGFEDRQDLLGHKNGRITTHYSNAELNNLLLAANMVCESEQGPHLTLLRMNQCKGGRAKVAQGNLRTQLKIV